MFSKDAVTRNLRERKEELEDKLKLLEREVEDTLPQIGLTISFRKRFYEITGFPVPEWFQEEME